MARTPRTSKTETAKPDDKPPAAEGHNSKAKPKTVLTADERAALLVHHVGKLRAQMVEVEAKRAPFKAAQETFTDLVNAAKSDLGKTYTRKRFMGLLEDVSSRLRNLLAEEEARAQDRIALGLPLYGVQADLFDGKRTDTERDAMDAEADGYLAGRRGSDPTVPPEFAIFSTQWMAGYHRGVEVNCLALKKVDDMVAARAPAKPPEPQPTAEDAEEAITAQARKLRRSGFMDTGPEGDGVSDADHEDKAA